MMLKHLYLFRYYQFRRFLLGIYSNHLVDKHVRLTPTRSTEDHGREILLEDIRYKQRKVEQKRWNYWFKMCQESVHLGFQENKSEYKLPPLQTEDVLFEDIISENHSSVRQKFIKKNMSNL